MNEDSPRLSDEDVLRVADAVLARLKAKLSPPAETWLSLEDIQERTGRSESSIFTALREDTLHGHWVTSSRPIVKRGGEDAWMQGKSLEYQITLCGCSRTVEQHMHDLGPRLEPGWNMMSGDM